MQIATGTRKTSHSKEQRREYSRILYNCVISSKEFCNEYPGGPTITEGKRSQSSQRKSHLRRAYLSPRKDSRTGCENIVWLRCWRWHWRLGRCECPGRRRGRRRGSTGY